MWRIGAISASEGVIGVGFPTYEGRKPYVNDLKALAVTLSFHWKGPMHADWDQR